MKHAESWEIVYKWRLIALEKIHSNGFERAVRPPWVRLILKNSEWKFLITREHRHEHDEFDYRLAWGKVFDDLESYLELRADSYALSNAALKAARLEAKEEAGVDEIDDLKIDHISKAWATIDWTLYYVSGTITHMSEQNLKDDEDEYGIEILFLSAEEVMDLIKSWAMKEERSIWVLIRYL